MHCRIRPPPSHPAHRVRHCSRRGFRGLAARPTPRKLHRQPCRPSSRWTTGNHAFLVGHAIGTQNYVCALFFFSHWRRLCALHAGGHAVQRRWRSTHHPLLQPQPRADPPDPNTNPAVVADGAIRATWVHSGTGARSGRRPQSFRYPVNHRCHFLGACSTRLESKTDLPAATYCRRPREVQRLSTTGGNAPGPGHGCDSPSDVGHTAFVDYTADYFFYTNQEKRRGR